MVSTRFTNRTVCRMTSPRPPFPRTLTPRGTGDSSSDSHLPPVSRDGRGEVSIPAPLGVAVNRFTVQKAGTGNDYAYAVLSPRCFIWARTKDRAEADQVAAEMNRRMDIEGWK